SFWTWREVMYAFAGRIGPEDLRAIAAQLYVEMLEAGYTRVCEFHYLHHAPDGRPYDDPAAMSLALVEAAAEAGIGLTLLPVLYQTGGFDGRSLGPHQRRFGMETDAWLELLQTLGRVQSPGFTVGAALHSLRAVPPEQLQRAVAALPREMPVHLHISEQITEVEECVAVRGARPVRWLLDQVEVDRRWCLVHATHLDADEVRSLAASGATVALCPTTEANLGDGLFPLRSWLDAGGRFGIGSDSHVSISPVEELRWLEYGQRLQTQQRNIAVTADSPSVGETLLRHTLEGGMAASGATAAPHGDAAELPLAARPDLVELDAPHPLLAACTPSDVIDTWLFSGNRPLVKSVIVGGRQRVEQGRHHARENVAARFGKSMRVLLG